MADEQLIPVTDLFKAALDLHERFELVKQQRGVSLKWGFDGAIAALLQLHNLFPDDWAQHTGPRLLLSQRIPPAAARLDVVFRGPVVHNDALNAVFYGTRTGPVHWDEQAPMALWAEYILRPDREPHPPTCAFPSSSLAIAEVRALQLVVARQVPLLGGDGTLAARVREENPSLDERLTLRAMRRMERLILSFPHTGVPLASLRSPPPGPNLHDPYIPGRR
ncbi:hypothetical protein JCM10213v2_001510 [Rhodosporidiobolus nylandii]